MYIEMVDETGQVSQEILQQTQEILEFAAQKIGKEDKEMAVTFVTNERSHELNLEYRDTDRPTDVISLEYKPELDISFDEEDLLENPELAEMMSEFDAYIGELFISIDKAHEQAEEYGHSFEGRKEYAEPCSFSFSCHHCRFDFSDFSDGVAVLAAKYLFGDRL